MLRIRALRKVIYRSCKSHSQCYDCVRLGNDAVGGSQMTCDPESVLYSFKLAQEDDQNTIQCCEYTFENTKTYNNFFSSLNFPPQKIEHNTIQAIANPSVQRLTVLLCSFHCFVLKK